MEAGSDLLYVLNEHRGKQIPRLFDDIVAQHRTGELRFPVGATGIKAALKVAYFFRPRSCKAQYFWCMPGLYQLLQMSSYKGKASKWIWNRMATWNTSFLGMFGSCQMIHSTHLHDGMLKRAAEPFSSRCLPWTGISTVGLLLLLVRWAFLARPFGGVLDSSPELAQAAKDVLLGVLRPISSCEPASWQFEVVVQKHWTCNWPRPLDWQQTPRSFAVAVKDGRLDFSEMFKIVENRDDGVLRSWCSTVAGFLGPSRLSSPGEFLQAAVGVQCLEPFVAQVLLAIAVHLEKYYGRATIPEEVVGSVTIAWDDVTDLLDSGNLGLKLSQYVVSAREMLRRHTMYCMANDKAVVCKLPLRNTFIAVPTGKAVVCNPVVGLRFP